MNSIPSRSRVATDYTVACICPMGVESAPVEAMLDEIHAPLSQVRHQNAYTLGEIGGHNIVVAVMPEVGYGVAATVATQLLNDFPSIQFGLLVGIGGGVPGATDVRLGDVVVSQATDRFGGVVQYDLGKKLHGGHFRRTGLLMKPPKILSASVRKLEGQHRRQGHKLLDILSNMLVKYPRMREQYAHPTSARDELFQPSYSHSSGATCDGCDPQQIVIRPHRTSNEPCIHYGTIGSANIVLKDAGLREELRQDTNLLCVEMEAAGIMDDFRCLVIRGICDYADSHKNKSWQPYAAAMAAAYMKELLLSIPAQEMLQPQDLKTEAFNKHFEVPHLLSPAFTGREDICQHLDKSLMLSPNPRRSTQRRFVLHGLGGSGKTQICLHYAQIHREKYWGIFWIDGSSIGSIRQSFDQVARVLDLEPDIDSVRRVLANMTLPWLLVFDNVDDPQLSLNGYFPTGDRGDLIITSRNPGCCQYGTVGHHEVGPMRDGESVALLFRIVFDRPSPPDEHQSLGGQEVANTLGHLALAVTQAGAYIRETSCTFDDYLELYRRRRRELLEYSVQHGSSDYRYTAYTTWQVSIDKIESSRSTTSVFALHILRLLCFYHHDEVPLSMFEGAWQCFQRGDDGVLTESIWPKTISDAFEFRHLMQAATALLGSFSLVNRSANASLSMHPVVHDWGQIRLNEQERQTYCRQAIFLLTESSPSTRTAAAFAYRRLLAPHARASFHAYKTICGPISEAAAMNHWSILAYILATNGFTQDALGLTQQIVNFRRDQLGIDHPSTLNSMHSLAIRYSEAGQQREALDLTEEVVQLRRRKLGPDHPDIIHSMHNLAARYSQAGRQHEAIKMAEEALQLERETIGTDHPDTLSSIHNLGMYYSRVGRQQEALALSEQAVQLQRNKLDVDHPDLLEALHSLAIRYDEAGRLQEAVELTEQVLQARQNKLGADHPDTLRSMHNLSLVYNETDRRHEALELMERVLQLRRSKLGVDHPDTLLTMHNLSIQYDEAGRQREALEMVEAAAQHRREKLGADHPDTLRSMHSLALRYGEAGRYQEALETTEQVLQGRQSLLGADHPQTLNSLHSMVAWYDELGRDVEALETAERVVRLRQSKLGVDHDDTQRSMRNLLILYNRAGREAEARVLAERLRQPEER